MKVGIVADTHYANHPYEGGDLVDGVNRRCREMLDVLRYVGKTFKHDVLVVAGDVFNSDRPTGPIVAALADVLHGPEFEQTFTYLMVGNHDMRSMTRHDNALAPLNWATACRVVDSPTVMREDPSIWLVPFGYDPIAMEPPAGTKVVIAHHGIWGEETPGFLRTGTARDSDLILDWSNKYGIERYYAGDWHTRQGYHGGRVVQIGALCPVSFANPGADGYGTVLTLERPEGDHLSRRGGHLVRVDIAPGPRFIQAEMASLLPALRTGDIGYARVKVGGVHPAKYRVVEVLAEDDRPRQAVAATTSPTNARQALQDFIAKDPAIPLDLKARVYDRAVDYLTKAEASE